MGKKNRQERRERFARKRQQRRTAVERADESEPLRREELARAGIRLDVFRPGGKSAGHSYRHWRFAHDGESRAFLDWWPTTGKYRAEGGRTGIADLAEVCRLALGMPTRGPEDLNLSRIVHYSQDAPNL